MFFFAGGSGTRLWLLSRTMLPKQFVRLFNNESLFQQTVKRNAAVCSRSLVVSNIELYFLAVDQLQDVPHAKVDFLPNRWVAIPPQPLL